MNRKWTIKDISAQDGKVIIVTGGNSGLGFESVKILAGKGAKVILACRSKEKGQEAKKRILMDYPEGHIEVMTLDLSNLASIRRFTDAYKEKFDKLHVLMNNAGVMNTPYSKTIDGFESQIGINHLGHFALTMQLLDLLKATPSARVVTISSLLHKQGQIDFDSFVYKENKVYKPEQAYAQSKLANLLFTFHLHKMVSKEGLDIKVLAAHPGGASTNLGRHQTGQPSLIKKFLYPLLIQTAQEGARPGLRAATDPTLESGQFIGPSGFMQATGPPAVVKAYQTAYKQDLAHDLWRVSLDLTRPYFRL